MSLVQEKFAKLREEMASFLIERDEETTLVLTALLCGEHVLLIGAPGTGKTMLAEAIVQCVGGKRFNHLLNDSTKPEELFGPVSVKGLKEDEYYRIVDNTMLDADIVLLDEIFKGSSMILNTTLKVLNEGFFRNGTKGFIKCPLRMVIGCSNEYPREAKELAALFDRFMFRKSLQPVSDEGNIDRLMFDDGLENNSISTELPVEELEQAQKESSEINFSNDAKEAAHEIRRKIAKEGVVVGDRRKRKTCAALKSFAYLNGRHEVTTDDMEVLQHMWWSHPDTQSVVADTVIEVARPGGLVAAQLLGDAQQVRRECNPSDLASAATAARKIGDIARQLSGTSPREQEARERVENMLKELKLASLEAVR